MSGSTRRLFLKSAGAGVAAAGAVAVVPSAIAQAAPATREKALAHTQHTEAMVAYIDDPSSGRISLMLEGHEVTIVDHQLVAQLAHAVHTAKSTSV